MTAYLPASALRALMRMVGEAEQMAATTGRLPMKYYDELARTSGYSPTTVEQYLKGLTNTVFDAKAQPEWSALQGRWRALQRPVSAEPSLRQYVAQWMDKGLTPDEMYERSFAIAPDTTRGSLAVLRNRVKKNRAAGKPYAMLGQIGGGGALGAIGAQALDDFDT